MATTRSRAKSVSKRRRPAKPARSLRQSVDEVLQRARGNRSFARRLIANPRETLRTFGLNDPWAILTDSWGVGPIGDCGADTCRLTQACGWTICGKTTNECGRQEDSLRQRMDEVLQQVGTDANLRQKLVSKPIETLRGLGFDADAARYVADAWGIGPAGDCADTTCRLTDKCGWTVCGKTTNSCAQQETTLRDRMDKVLEQVRADAGLRQKLVSKPIDTLRGLGFDADAARYVADAWGIGPAGDCADTTCRLTDKCGWTVCGKTTNSCAQQEDTLRGRMDDVLAQINADPDLRRRVIDRPARTLATLGFEPDVVRYVADAWGIGPVGDCGHDTCRLTQACGWTVCGKTTNDCAQG